MEQQKHNTEEKKVKIFYLENTLRNKYGLNCEFSKILSTFIVDFFENLFKNYDFEKVKRIRNAQSNLSTIKTKQTHQKKITFYIGLMDKDNFCYKHSKERAIQKVIDILGDCTIQNGIGAFSRDDGMKIKTDTLIVTKILKEYDGNYIHYKTKELKKYFNQASIITEENYPCLIEYNNYKEETEKEIENLMKEYELTWTIAKEAYESGII